MPTTYRRLRRYPGSVQRFIILYLAVFVCRAQIVERVGSTGFVKVGVDSFQSLSARDKALAYWLAQAAIAIDPIIYDQQSPCGLRQKRLLEAIVSHPSGIPAATFKKIDDYTKLFWANRGNHNETRLKSCFRSLRLTNFGARRCKPRKTGLRWGRRSNSGRS
jgi:hypothetical protein